jgi:hypothetical protein
MLFLDDGKYFIDDEAFSDALESSMMIGVHTCSVVFTPGVSFRAFLHRVFNQ